MEPGNYQRIQCTVWNEQVREKAWIEQVKRITIMVSFSEIHEDYDFLLGRLLSLSANTRAV